MTLSNLITISRIALAPIILVLILYGAWTASIVLLVIAFATDILDGYLARKLKQATKLGKVLDPAADKILVFLVLFGLLFVLGNAKTNWLYMLMFFSKDIFSFFFILLSKKVKLRDLNPRALGKITTFAQAFALFWLMFRLEYLEILFFIVFALGIASGIDYYAAFGKSLKKPR